MSAEVAKYWSKTLHIPHEGDNNLINSCVRLNPAYPKFNISDSILQVSTNLILNNTQFLFPVGVFQHYNELLNSITGKPSVRWGWKHNNYTAANWPGDSYTNHQGEAGLDLLCSSFGEGDLPRGSITGWLGYPWLLSECWLTCKWVAPTAD